MARWEVKYIDLYVGNDMRLNLARAKEEIDRLGDEGWEPVGQVTFRYEQDAATTITVPQLVLKRPRMTFADWIRVSQFLLQALQDAASMTETELQEIDELDERVDLAGIRNWVDNMVEEGFVAVVDRHNAARRVTITSLGRRAVALGEKGDNESDA